MRLTFSKMSKEVYSHYPPTEILNEYLCLLQENIFTKENYLSLFMMSPEEEKLICKPFVPSKTAQNGLNFITKEEELLFSHENLVNLPAREEINAILKIIYILIRQNYEKIEENLLGDQLINKILSKMKIDNLSNDTFKILETLFQNVICNNLLLSNDQISKIISIVEKTENVLNPTYILKSCKVIAYVTFIIKEIYEYLTVKAHDGTPILYLRKHRNNLKKLKEKYSKLKKLQEEKKFKI
jgi:hypothetical protein